MSDASDRTRARWMSIVARSATLTDRLAAYHAGRSSRHLPPDGTLDRWCEAASDGDPNACCGDSTASASRRLTCPSVSPNLTPHASDSAVVRPTDRGRQTHGCCGHHREPLAP